MAMADAEAEMAPCNPPGGADEEEDACRICHLPAEAERPLRYPCACRGTIRFVHDDCLLRWLATRRTSPSRCEVCKRIISVTPVYALNAPARLSLPEFLLGLANKFMGWLFLLLALLFAIYVWEFVMPLTTVWVWRLALSRTFAQVHHLLSLRFSVFPRFHGLTFMPSPDTVLACVTVRRAFLRELPNLRQLNAPARIAADALAPFALWIARIEACLQTRFGGLDTLQVLALHTVEAALIVVIGDVVFAFALGFLPFSLGRIALCCISCFSFGNMDIDRSYASTASILLIGYGLILSLVLLLIGLHTFQQYSRGEHLTISILFMVLLNSVHWLSTPFRMLPGIHVMVDRTFTFLTQFIIWSISLANVSLNLTLILVICPLFFGWSLDISTSKLFDVTMSQKLKLIFASSYASTALHWLIGCICLKLWSLLSSFLCPVLNLRVSIPFIHSARGQIKMASIGEPFYKYYFKMLPDLLFSLIYVTMFILVPVEIVFHLAPTMFPLDIIYFDPPTQGSGLWQSLRSYAELLSGLLLLRFLIWNTLKYLEPGAFVDKVLRYWFAVTSQAVGLSEFFIAQADGSGESKIGNSVDQNPYEAKRSCVAIRIALLVVLAWLTVVIFNSTVLVAPVSVGRALLFSIPHLPVAGALRSNDLFAFAVGFCIISTIIAASRDSFTYMTSGRRHLGSVICNWGVTALKSSPLLLIWIVIIPFLIGLLVDCLLISPFVVPTNEVPVLDFFCIWFLGTHLLKFWTKLVCWTRVVPFLSYFIDERWDLKLTQAWSDGFSGLRAIWVMQDVLMPISAKLLSALLVPYVLAKGVFPTFGYSIAVNSTVHRFAWLGSLGVCVLYHLGKLACKFFVKLHDSIRDERYLVGQKLQNYTDNGEASLLRGALLAILNRAPSNKTLGILQGFATGLMLSMSFFDLAYDAVNAIGFLKGNLWFFAGALLFSTIADVFPEPDCSLADETGKQTSNNIAGKELMMRHRRRVIFSVVVTAIVAGVSLQNFPVGTAAFLGTTKGVRVSLNLALAIALHYIPEGISIALPAYFATSSKWQAFKLATLSGFAEPLGVIIVAYVFPSNLNPEILEGLLGLVGGVMAFLTLYEMLPLAFEYAGRKDAVKAVFVGMAFMSMSLYFLDISLPKDMSA